MPCPLDYRSHPKHIFWWSFFFGAGDRVSEPYLVITRGSYCGFVLRVTALWGFYVLLGNLLGIGCMKAPFPLTIILCGSLGLEPCPKGIWSSFTHSALWMPGHHVLWWSNRALHMQSILLSCWAITNPELFLEYSCFWFHFYSCFLFHLYFILIPANIDNDCW